MSRPKLYLKQSRSAVDAGWAHTLEVNGADGDGDVPIKLLMSADNKLPNVYLDRDAQRALRDFLNGQLDDTVEVAEEYDDDFTETVGALDDLTDAILGLTEAIVDRPVTINNSFSEAKKPTSSDTVDGLLKFAADVFNGKDKNVR